MTNGINMAVPPVPGSVFFPVCREDMTERGWAELDFLLVSGDAYVDHPSFGPAVIARVLESCGYRVGILPQPDWRTKDAFLAMGRPRLAVLVTAGNLDSMLNKFTASKKNRSDDSYSPGGKSGHRPDRATIAYCSRVKECWKDVPLVIGGVEASLRRFAHYDYWSDEVRRSVLFDSQADILVYGMGEKQIREIADLLDRGVPAGNIRSVRGTMYRAPSLPEKIRVMEVPSFEEAAADRVKFAEAFRLQYLEQDPFHGRTVAQRHGTAWVIQNPPPLPLSEKEMDDVYGLPYTRTYHPMYEKDGGVPAIKEVRFSLVSHRGCFGSCSFCAIHSHQGRIIQARSHDSLLSEARLLTTLPDFKGYIHDVGGPTANFRIPACSEQFERGACRNRQCLFPSPCPKLRADHRDYLELLRKLRSLPGVKKVFIRSGIRFDYLLADKKTPFLEELCAHHVSGQLKIAPEHVSADVLRIMGKPGREVYERFMEAFRVMNTRLGKKQYLVPYFISSHPGAELKDAVELAEFLRDIRFQPEQVQDFVPAPGSPATCIYWTGIDPMTGEPVHVPKSREERKMQRALLQYREPKNRETVIRALEAAGRSDLVGEGALCLVRPQHRPERGRLSAPILPGGKKTGSRSQKRRTDLGKKDRRKDQR
ncbi:MAG: YgiQ family radical SAM protein [Aminobacteriaceae bacterium]|nr:YgiQ family radical SAM protein [Synergistaceae bacterium]MDD4020745.1 YgiQ family radical SAM protein [Synergistaceae bacterium]MDD4611625.1 YgiQ family radical SAM protein [Synergistaceae bacterium]